MTKISLKVALPVLKVAAVAGGMMAFGAGMADAAQVFGVEVWIGKLPSTSANAANELAVAGTSGLTHATFDFTGAINWSNAIGTNLFSDFVTNGTISNYSGNVTQAALAATSLSNPGDTYSAFFKIAGVYTAGIAGYDGSVIHDDGASLYADYGIVFEHPAETAALTNSFSLSAGTHTFTLDYVEGNGAPSVLQIDFPAEVASDLTDTPEPMSLALLGSGLAGIALARRRRGL